LVQPVFITRQTLLAVPVPLPEEGGPLSTSHGFVCLKKPVGVAEKRFCEAKTFGARGSSVKKSLLQGKIGLPSTSTVLPPS
jgi:hypothetical protein